MSSRAATATALATATFTDLPGSFCLFYQPALDLYDGSIRTCEALLRWLHPDHGVLRPGAALGGSRWSEDLPVIADWAIREVCRQSEAWHEEGHDVQVAVNVSHAQLLRADLLVTLDTALADTGLDPEDLAVDVPFASLSGDPTGFGPIVAALATRGVTVVADGVGGGVSLASVVDLGTSVWKLDLPVEDGRGDLLHPSVHAALATAQACGLTTVAKAVEFRPQLDQLRSLGFDRAFGRAVSPPVTPESMREILRRSGERQRRLTH